MSVFQSSFDWFQGYVEGPFLDDLGMTTSSYLEADINGPEPDQQILADAGEIDPFAWAAGGHDGSLDAMPTGSPFEPATADSLPGALVGLQGGLEGDTDGSPADRWLSGGEWHGSISSGTIDPTGEGNHVISVGGEVLNLP
jgi:hypothetical protein